MPAMALVAVALDYVLGEPRRYHPLIGFGWLANRLEAWLNPARRQARTIQRLTGSLALLLLLSPFVLLAWWLCNLQPFGIVANILLLYFALGHKSLHQHAHAVTQALDNNDETQARIAASWMVSRDSAAIEPVPATIESVLENGNDGVFGALFWFFVLGGAGALLFRLANTMDAMWGYKTPRLYYFGWAAARLDDVLNYIPARLTALTYALLGKTRTALRCWASQAPLWDSPNAGPVMAAGAGALDIKLGGAARYQDEWHLRPQLGSDKQALATDIDRALKLVRHGVYLWLALFLLIVVIYHA
jgi:adenosylcobinamide-phosphate synthase